MSLVLYLARLLRSYLFAGGHWKPPPTSTFLMSNEGSGLRWWLIKKLTEGTVDPKLHVLPHLSKYLLLGALGMKARPPFLRQPYFHYLGSLE